jgi:AraC-like DNA-binding protein
MLDSLYSFFRGASGFSMVVIGLSFFFEPRKDRVRSSFGLLFMATGSLFTLSALDSILDLQIDLSTILTVFLVFALSQALFNISLYFLGNEANSALRRRVRTAGLLWSTLLCLAPLLDYALGWGSSAVSIEDSRPMGPVRGIVSVALYLWPIAICLVTAVACRGFGVGSTRSRATRVLGSYAAVAAAILGLVLASLVVDSELLYKIVQTCLQVFLLIWFYALCAKPQLFAAIREEIRKGREGGVLVDDAEAARIGRRLDTLLQEGELILKSDLDLAALAQRLEIPAYRLSSSLNTRLGTSFPAWLNAQRIQLVCERLLRDADRSILDIAMDSGYGSKAVFNEQFRKITGMSPSEYRRSRAVAKK